MGTALGARRGLLIRGGDVLEKVSSVDTVVFDKTGTLTAGRPSVTRVVMCSGDSNGLEAEQMTKVGERDILELAAGVERFTTHPVAQAIVRAAEAAGCRLLEVSFNYCKKLYGNFKFLRKYVQCIVGTEYQKSLRESTNILHSFFTTVFTLPHAAQLINTSTLIMAVADSCSVPLLWH